MIRKTALLVVFIFIVVSLTVYKLDFVVKERFPVTVAVSKTPLSSPFYIAQYINAFDDTCVDVQFTEVIGGLSAFKQVVNGKVDFATSSASVIAYQSLQGYRFVTHAVFAESDNDVKLVTRTEDNISAVVDLKGKTIGVVKETAGEYFLSNLLALDGLTFNDVTLVSYQPAELTSALRDKQIDAMISWEPFVFESKNHYPDLIDVHDTKGVGALSFNLISKESTPELLEKTTCLLQGLNSAVEFIATNPQQSKRIIQSSLNISDEFIDWVWPDYIFKLSLNNSLIQDIKSQYF